MTIHWVDWTLVLGLVVVLFAIALSSRLFTHSVADYLTANRVAGRYLLCTAEFIMGMGAISVIAMFETTYAAGFSPQFWILMSLPVGVIIAVTGWVVYRFRATRAMTTAQFFEQRYSRSFRLFCGVVGFLAAMANFGIYPAVSAKFFFYFFQLPETVHLVGLTLPVYPIVMLLLVGMAVFMAFAGGQISVITSDYLQGFVFVIGAFAITFVFLFKFDWTTISESLVNQPEGQSLINPFDTGQIDHFNFWFYLILLLASFYGTMAWPGGQVGFAAAAKSPHELKMSKVLGQLRVHGINAALVFLPICAFVVMHHPMYAERAAQVNTALATIEVEEVRNQMVTPMAIQAMLPVGLTGMLGVMMLAAFISTNQSYLLSYSSIFVQDVVLPIRGDKHLSQKAHMWLLRGTVLGVAVFVVLFSLLFRQTDYILMYFQMTAAIYIGGAGSAIIGGLYWKRGTTAGAWTAMISGALLGGGGLVAQQMIVKFPLNGQWVFFISCAVSATLYVVVSFLTSHGKKYDLDRLLHRGRYAKGAQGIPDTPSTMWGRWKQLIGVTEEFTMGDKALYWLTFVFTFGMFGLFVIVTIYNLSTDVSDTWWLGFWKWWLILLGGFGSIITFIILLLGIPDLITMFVSLKEITRNEYDDGTVRGGRNVDEVIGGDHT